MQSVPEVEFAALASLPQTELDVIRRKGCVVIRNVVDDAEAASWRADLRDYVKTNPVAGASEIASLSR